MYLSQLILNPHNRQVQRELAQPYDLHRTLTKNCFDGAAIDAQRNTPRATAENAYGLLFRLDVMRDSNTVVLLAQSQIKPNWAKLPAGYALQINGPKDFDLIGKLFAGQTLGFRLRASPTKRLGNSHPFKEDIGKRVPIKIESEQLDWLHRKANQHGFKVVRVAVSQKERQYGHKDGYAMQWHSVCFDGVLAVQDADVLRTAVESGIGSAKGMGFGLLSLAPPPSPPGIGSG